MAITLEDGPTGGAKAVSEQDARNFLQRFQFPQKRWFDRVGALSGGERRRLQLLQILARRPNVLVFDEPSNDLDLSTLAALEDYITESFEGSLVVVSHDEFFMNKVTDHLLVFEGHGVVKDFQGSYSDYLKYRKEQTNAHYETTAELKQMQNAREEQANVAAVVEQEQVASVDTEGPARRKLSHAERKEYNKLESQMAKLLVKIEKLDAQLIGSDAAQGYSVLADMAQEAEAARASLVEMEERWLELAEHA